MIHGKSGLITLAVVPATPKDTTLRLHKAMKSAHVLLSANPKNASNFVQSLELTSDFVGNLTVVDSSLSEWRQK